MACWYIADIKIIVVFRRMPEHTITRGAENRSIESLKKFVFKIVWLNRFRQEHQTSARFVQWIRIRSFHSIIRDKRGRGCSFARRMRSVVSFSCKRFLAVLSIANENRYATAPRGSGRPRGQRALSPLIKSIPQADANSGQIAGGGTIIRRIYNAPWELICRAAHRPSVF